VGTALLLWAARTAHDGPGPAAAAATSPPPAVSLARAPEPGTSPAPAGEPPRVPGLRHGDPTLATTVAPSVVGPAAVEEPHRRRAAHHETRARATGVPEVFRTPGF
jgi:hypothetical protein